MSGKSNVSGRRAQGLWRRFLAERRGAAAVEFALIVPFMLVLYLLSMEFSLAIEVSKKVNRVAMQVANLVTQSPSTTTTELDAIFEIGDATLQPFRGTPDVTVTGIEVTMEKNVPVAKVVWSHGKERLTSKQEVNDVPETYMKPGVFLIHAKVRLDYSPVIAPAQGSSILGISDGMFPIEMSEKIYMMSRSGGGRIECTNCP